ncbi:unnamed protein product [Cyprideis torosa]|uniref:Cation/H+ exchanger transmembrane domain-containing protein n=1 Tax=Cyprideis torosa TaxID=163714 RepID=A0A7R8W8M9_9CRUS|nr:unnamed protein product [Cyprideis torosa]CAG0888753.1 unnamed protein product [Cyprideis torosa]
MASGPKRPNELNRNGAGVQEEEEERPTTPGPVLGPALHAVPTTTELIHESMDALPQISFFQRLSNPFGSVYHRCPSRVRGPLGELLTRGSLFFALLVALYAMTYPDVPLQYLGYFLIVGGGLVSGWLIHQAFLPPLLGMLLFGILLTNLPLFPPGISVEAALFNRDLSRVARGTALAIILTRAGLGLDPAALRKLGWVVVRLAFSPCLAEACVVAVLSHLLLQMPLSYAFMLGFMVAAVSPAVVVPCMLTLAEQGYGVAKGIPTLVIAASSIDDVLAISAFGVIMGSTLSTGDSIQAKLAQPPIEVALGLSYGAITGALCWCLPVKEFSGNIPRLRTALLISLNLVAVHGSTKIGFSGAGPLACIFAGFVAALGWREDPDWGDDGGQVARNFADVWYIFQPILFGLIGLEMKWSYLQLDIPILMYGLIPIFVALVVRVLVAFGVVWGANLRLGERFFVAVAWLPKATVQAALGPLVYDQALAMKRVAEEPGEDADEALIEEALKYGRQLLMFAVVVILITAPVGAALTMISAPRLLDRHQRGKAGGGDGTGVPGSDNEERDSTLPFSRSDTAEEGFLRKGDRDQQECKV